MSNLSCGTHVAEPSANKDCRKLLNQFCRFLPKLKLPISADAKLPLTAKYTLQHYGRRSVSCKSNGCASLKLGTRKHYVEDVIKLLGAIRAYKSIS